jgi:DNA polymerase-1
VHDELVFDAHPDEIETLRTLVEHEMKEALPLDGVPILVDIDVGDNWLDAH